MTEKARSEQVAKVMEQVREYAAKTGEEIRRQITRRTPAGTVSIYLVYDRLFCVKSNGMKSSR